MTKEEAINRVQGYLTDYLPIEQCGELEEIIKALEQEPKWIPCIERLPKESGKYLCTFGGTNLTGIDFHMTESYAKKIFDVVEECDLGWQSKNVIAWMPLPIPYKAEMEKER